jgi:hypothetical protein
VACPPCTCPPCKKPGENGNKKREREKQTLYAPTKAKRGFKNYHQRQTAPENQRTMTGVSQHWFSGHFRQVFSTPMHYPALTLAPTCGANRTSCQVFINAGARLLCTSDGVCVIVYVQFSSVGAGMVWGGGSSLHSQGIEFGE